MLPRKGRLIVIEGPDGSGKATQAKMLMERLKREHRECMIISFPNYESESSALVKNYLTGKYSDVYLGGSNLRYIKQVSSFYAVDRVATMIDKKYNGKSAIELLQRTGMTIILDRYYTSNMLHMSANLTGASTPETFVKWVESFETDLGLPEPDAVFFLNVSLETSLANITGRNDNKHGGSDLHEQEGHLRKVHDIKNNIIDWMRWVNIDCMNSDGTMKTMNEVHQLVYNEMKGRIF